LEHVLFFDGNTKRISWAIQTDNSVIEQKREHADIYLDKVTNQQSKYMGLHVGLFWGIGIFIIKNQDVVKIAIDDTTRYLSIYQQIKKIMMSLLKKEHILLDS
jgi:hypothetical protein